MGRIKLLTAAVIGLIVFFAIITSSYSDTISPRDENLIKVAYMNGFYDALRLSMVHIKRLRSDKILFQKEIEIAAESYLNTVKKMNK